MHDDVVDALRRHSGQLQEVAEGFRNRVQGNIIVLCLKTMATPPFRYTVYYTHDFYLPFFSIDAAPSADRKHRVIYTRQMP